MRAEEFAASVGFDALRISMGGKPRLHDVETICRWLRHVSAQGTEAGTAEPGSGSVHEGLVSEADAPTPDPRKEALAVLEPFDAPPRWANFYRTMERMEKSDRNKAVWAGHAHPIEAALATLSATDKDGEARGDA